MAEGYFINGQDVGSFLTSFQRVDGTMGVPGMRQSDYSVPGRTGVVPVLPWFGAKSMVLGGTIQGSDRTDFQTRMRAFMSLCFNSGQPFTMRRVFDVAGGTLAVSSQARYTQGLEGYAAISPTAARVAAEFLLLDGFWYDETEVNTLYDTATFSIDVRGDAPTSKIKLRFNNSAVTQRLTNSTTSDWVQTTQSTASQSLALDVEAFTALQGATNRIGTVSANTAQSTYYWMTLRPGINTLALTGGGTVRVQYRSAWL